LLSLDSLLYDQPMDAADSVPIAFLGFGPIAIIPTAGMVR